jgi:hypothetical protein
MPSKRKSANKHGTRGATKQKVAAVAPSPDQTSSDTEEETAPPNHGIELAKLKLEQNKLELKAEKEKREHAVKLLELQIAMHKNQAPQVVQAPVAVAAAGGQPNPQNAALANMAKHLGSLLTRMSASPTKPSPTATEMNQSITLALQAVSNTLGLPRGAETELQATLEKVDAQAKGIRQAATKMKALQDEKDDKKRKEAEKEILTQLQTLEAQGKHLTTTLVEDVTTIMSRLELKKPKHQPADRWCAFCHTKGHTVDFCRARARNTNQQPWRPNAQGPQGPAEGGRQLFFR